MLKQNNIFFGCFLKYWLSSHDFNKLVIKAKMHAKTYIFLNFLCMKTRYDFFERLGRMHESKTFFCFIIFSTF
jgi:hypothetical protein